MWTNWLILESDLYYGIMDHAQIVCSDLEHCNIANTLIRHIMVPFDNSKHAVRAFGHALDLAKKYGAAITVVSITDEDQSTEWLNGTPSRQKALASSRNAEFRRIFKLLEAQAAKFQIHLTCRILESNTIGESLISFSTMNKVDYIVMGTHGKGMVKEMMLGRVSTNVALNATCPVVLVK
jgi:nucleotide-binding universal stress UspA family protein